MIRHLIRRHGFLAVTVGMTVSSVLFAILLLVVLDLILKGSVPLVDLVIVVIIPGVIAPVMTSSFIRLVHQLDQAEEKLKILAREDPLTKTFNRRHFMELAEAEWERASRYGAPLSLLLLDVDHFKRINDRHGHAVGDQLLVGMADALQASLRKPDVLARFGGEEFVVLLPETPRERAWQVAERLREAIPQASANLVPGGVTVSIGVSHVGSGAPDLEALLGQADRALYAAKQTGRNRVELAVA